MSDQFVWIFRIFLSAIAGALVGYERYSQSKEAGVKTHSIVALASAMMMILSKYGFADTGGADTARIAAQVVSGVGFIGAGLIFIKCDVIQGLTTAAGIWATCGIGMCIGAGMYIVGIFTAVMIVAVQLVMRHSKHFGGTHLAVEMEVEMDADYSLENLKKYMSTFRLQASDFRVIRLNGDTWIIHSHVIANEEVNLCRITENIRSIKEIHRVSIIG